MAKTYTLAATLNTGHLNGSDTMEPSWSNFLTWNDAASNVGYAGYDSPYWRYATNMLFDQTTLASLRNKVSNGTTVTGLTLTVNCTQAMTGETLIGYKANSTASGNGSSGAWARCHNDGTAGADANSVAYQIDAHTLSTGTQTFNLKRTTPYSGIPQYGLVAGPQTNVTGRWRFTSATLNVTTNEITVSYNKGANGSGTNVTDTITSGATLRGATFTRTGYTQTGWATSDGGAKVYNLSATYSGTSDLTLYPYWTIISYTVSYNVNGGSGTFNSQTKNYGSSITLHSGKPTKSPTSAGSYTVTYNANGGSVSPASASAARTTSYAFSAWNTAQNGSGTSYAAGATYSANASATLYAQYTSSTTTASVSLASNVSRTGYNFNGWYTAASGGTRVGGAGSSYTPTGNVTLYAQWTASSATLSSVSPATVDCGNNLTGSWTSTGNYYYKLKVTCGNATATWSNPTSAGAQSVAVQIPTTWYSMNNGPLRDSETATATCELYTYSDSACTTQVGTASSKTFTVKVPASVKPTLSSGALTASSSSTNSVVSGWGSSVFVQGYSKVTLTLSVSDWHGSRIKEVRFGGLGLSSTKSSLTSDASSVITSAGTFQYYAECEDMRGHVSEKAYVSVTVQPYSQPSVSYITVARCDNTAPDYPVNNAAGLFFKAIPSYGFSSVSGNNHLQVQTIQYRIHPNGGWSAAETCASDVRSGPWSSALTNSYDVMVTLADDLQVAAGTSSYTHFTTTLPTVQGIWFGKGNDRLGLGGVPEGAGLYCDWDATFKGVLDVVPRRCYAPLSSEGWYRVMVFDGSSSWVAGGIGFTVDITLLEWARQATKITLWGVAGALKFANEQSVSYAQLFDKIRYMQKDGYGYIDIHYTAAWSGSRYVACYFDVKQTHNATYTPAQFESWWTAVNFTPVDPSPSGETVLTEYTFAANRQPTVLKTYVETTYSNYTIGNNGYLELDYPLGLTGDQVVSIGLVYWASNSGPFSLVPAGEAGNHWYIIGAAGTTITNARFRFWYID